MKKTAGTLLDDQRNFMIISRGILRRMRRVSGKICRKYRKTAKKSEIISPEYRAVYEIM
jgi:hypothetical protein